MKGKEGKSKTTIIFIIFIVLLALALYFTFFFTRACKNEECFYDGLDKCERIHYSFNDKNVVWLYTIQGKAKENCKINVKITQAKSGVKEVENLVGKDMTCYQQLGLDVRPEYFLENCNGILKEELQTMIIKKIHQYILNNLGEIEKQKLGEINVTSVLG